jgi:type IV pilus assembly protein PilB
MGERRNLGDILQDLGRITQDDVDRALEHQRENGGFFGEALIALGIVREEELGWSLASQFDLPYVFPDADGVDPEAASLVSPDWALEHVAIPLTRTGRRLALLIDSPLKTRVVEELQERTGLQVEVALASTGAIREVIRKVFARGRPGGNETAGGEAMALRDLAELAAGSGASRWGLSVRGERALGWYDQGSAVRRYPLRPGWERELDALLSPSAPPHGGILGESRWPAHLAAGSADLPVEVRSLASPDGREILFLPRDRGEAPGGPPDLPVELLDELRLLLERGSLALAVRSDPSELARGLLPHLPGLVLPEGHRAIHLVEATDGVHHPRVFSLPPEEAEELSRERLARLGDFRFDAVTVEPDPDRTSPWDVVSGVAPFAFVLVPAGAPEGWVEGADWLLEVQGRDGSEELGWTLRPVEG